MQRRTFLAASIALPSALAHSRAWGQHSSAWSYTLKKPEGPVSNFALVGERPGAKIYASNAITVQVVVMTPTIEWVLTGADLRCVDRRKDTVQVFPLGEDALTGTIHEMVADETEAFLQVTLAGKTFLRCFHPLQGLRESIPMPTFWGEYSLALSSDSVAYVPRSNLYSQKLQAPLLLNRRTRKWATLSPVSTDKNLIVQSAVLSHDRLWLGTSQGLWSAPLQANAAWKCWLPARQISHTALLPDDSMAVVSGEKRTTLKKVNLQTGKITPLPPPLDAAVSLFAAPDGTLWQLGSKDKYPGLTLNKLSVGGSWESIPWSAASGETNAPLTLPDVKTVPDSVAAMLVNQLHLMWLNRRVFAFPVPWQTPWLQQRFWRWLGTDQSAPLLQALFARASASPRTQYRAANRTWRLDELGYLDENTKTFVPVPCRGQCLAIASLPSQPDTAVLLVLLAGITNLYVWHDGKLSTSVVREPPGTRQLNALCTVGKNLYIAASDGVWCHQTGGKWEPLLSGLDVDILISDPQTPGVLWARSGGIITESVDIPVYVVRLEI